METIAEKVRHCRGARFDPLVEGKKGWISGKAPNQDVEMANAIIEVMAKLNQHTFRAQSGEVFPSNLERNNSSFLVRKDVVPFKVDSCILLACITMLQDQVVIAKFVGPNLTPKD